MPKALRERRERTDKYHLILQWCRTPEQRLYEGIRPIILFGVPPAERAQETGVAESTLRRAASAFDTHGMISLFRPTKAQREDHHRSLPVPMRQLIVDLKTEYPDFTLGEIATICAIQFDGRRPGHHMIKATLADGPPPSRTTRQFPRYEEIAESMDTTTVLLTVTLDMIVVSLGIGVLQPTYTVAGQNAIAQERLGTGTGAMNYLRAMGSLLGTAVLGAMVTHSTASSRATSLSPSARQVLAMGLEHVFLVTFGVGIAVLIITFFLKDVRLRKRGEGMPTQATQAAATSLQVSSPAQKDSNA